MAAASFRGRASEFYHSNSRELKGTFAVATVAILFGALASQVDNDRRLAGTRTSPDPHLVTIDLDFLPADGSREGGFYSLGPLGQVDLGRNPSQRFITYTSGPNSIAIVPAGTSYSGLDWWKGEAGSRPASVDGVHARYEHFFPSTAAEVVAGIDGVEFTLEIRSRPLVGVGELSYDFWLDASPGLIPGQAGRPLLASNAGVATVRGSVPIMDGAGRPVFVVTPATAFVEFRAAPGPTTGRSVSAYETAFPAHEQGERQSVPLDYRLERVGSRTRVSVVLPADLFLDPAIHWPVRVDPGITNPIANSSYFADETILMDSDLVVTSTGAAQFSNVTLIMNRTASPNYNISVGAGGRMTLLSSTVKSNDSGLPYKFTVNGSFTAQDTLIQHANDGLQLLGDSATLSNVTLQNGTGRGLVLQGGNLTATRLDIKSPSTTGLFTQSGDLQVSLMNVTYAGAEGVYINATSGNITQSHILNATLNGAKVVNASRVNITMSELAGSGRNGLLVIGGAPSLENSSVTANNWSGVALFDDHSAYLYGNRIALNNWSGVETRLNSTADLYSNIIEGNQMAGVRAIASDPNVELNTVSGNDIGVWLEGAHNAGAKPGSDASTEDGYSYIMTASAELGDGTRVPLAAGITIVHQGASTQSTVPPGTKQFTLRVTNTDSGGAPQPITLSIDNDQPAWASLSTTSMTLAHGAYQDVTLTVTVPSGATPGSTYDVKVWANETLPPNPKASVWAYVDLQSATQLQSNGLTVPNQTTVQLTASLTVIGAPGGPLSGKTVAFKLEGHWIGEATTDAGGMAQLQYTLAQPPLTQTLQVYFNGTQYYVASSTSANIIINFTNTTLWMDSSTARWGDPTSLTARLEAVPGPGHVVARWIHFTIDGTYAGKVMTNNLGYATWLFEDTYDVGDVDWNASFDGDNYAGPSANSTTFASQKEITVLLGSSLTVRQGETPGYAAHLTDDEGYDLEGMDVMFYRQGNLLATVATDSDGLATYGDTGAASLGEGNYSLQYSFATDSHYLAINYNPTLTVRRWSTHFEIPPPTQYWGDSVALTAQLRDEDGNNLSSRTVKAYVGGVLIGETTTNATGWASVTDATVREVDTYNMSFYYAGSTRDFQINTTSNLTVVREITQTTALVDARITLGDVLTVTIRLTEDDGVPLSRPINVTLFGGLYFNGTTNATGYLNVTFNSRGLLPQRYVLWYFFGGEEHHAPSQAYTRIVVEHVSDLYANIIQGNGYGVKANNSSSVLWGNAFTGNAHAINVTNGTLLVYNSTVAQSTLHDFEVGKNASLYSTNTTFSRGKVDFAGDAILLHVRWFLGVVMMDTRPFGLPGPPNLYTLTVQNSSGAVVYNQTQTALPLNQPGGSGLSVPDCEASSLLCPLVTLTEYIQNASGKFAQTAHRITGDGQGVTIIMDATKRLTLFLGNDSDFDGLPNSIEDAADVYWYEAEGHVFDHTQFVTDDAASQRSAVARLEGDGRLTDPGSFLPVVGGTYTLLFRAMAGQLGAELRLKVADQNGSELLNVTYAPYTSYRWFTSPAFSFTGNQSIQVNLSDATGGGAGASLRLDELALARLLAENGTRVHWPGQVSNPYDGDVDMDRGVDGAEIRNGTVWYEAENLAPNADGRWVASLNASNSWAVQHADGNLTILSFNQSALPRVGVYALWLRARGDGEQGVVNVQVLRDGALRNETNLSFPEGAYAYGQYRFEWPLAHNVTVVLRDGADGSAGLNDSATFVDKLGLILELARPTSSFNAIVNGSLLPAAGTNLVYVEKTVVTNMFDYPMPDWDAVVNNTAMVYWVGGEYLFGMPADALRTGSSVAATWSYHVGVNATQPIVFTLGDGTRMLATLANDHVFAFRLPILPSTTPLSLIVGGGGTNPMAYASGWLVYTTVSGEAWGLEINKSAIAARFAYNPGNLTTSHAVATIYSDKAYFGYDDGLMAVNYNLSAPSKIAWILGPGYWPDPRDHCPGFYEIGSPCDPPGSHALTYRGVYSTPLLDTGNVYVVAHNNTEADLVRLTEDGQVIWSVNLGWPAPMVSAADTTMELALRNDAIVVNGPVLKAITRNTGQVLVGHDFEFGNPTDMGGSPVLTDRELITPGPDGLYFFAYPNGTGFGDSFAHDTNHTFGGIDAEDLLWVVSEAGKPQGQVLVGDFDGSGMRDIILTGATNFAFLRDFEAGHRNYLEYTQLGKDAAHGGNAEYLYRFVPTDPLDPDMDFDNVTDGYEVAGFFGWKQVEAEDAFNFTPWAHNESVGGPKNFNFFHQTGVTLTADDGSVTNGLAPNTSMIQFWMNAQGVNVYRMHLVSNPNVTSIVDLRFQNGSSGNATQNPDTSQGLGVNASLHNRTMEATELPVSLNESQQERIRQMVENATYLKVKYYTLDPMQQAEPNFTSFGVKHDTKVSVYKAVWANGTGGSLWVSVFISMDIDFELLGGTAIAPRGYVFELGLNLSLVNQSALGGGTLPASVSRLRIQDLDRLEFYRRGLDPFGPDSDADSVLDGDEALGFPLNADVDQDGLSDYYEVNVYGTNPGDKDTDHDGIRDRVELGLTGNTDPYTVYDTTESLASYPEYLAARFRGDPFFSLPKYDRTLPNNDQDPTTVTDPLNEDSDGDGIPDGWVDGWIYDPSYMIGQVQHSTATTEYLSRAQPQNYDVKYWHQSGIYDNYAQIWEGEDANLDGAVTGNQSSGDPKMHWAFWPSMTGQDGEAADATLLSYVRKGWGETNASNPDSDGDRIPEGFEVWYTTRSPIFSDIAAGTYYFTPVTVDNDLDVDSAYGALRINYTPLAASDSYKKVITQGVGTYVAQGIQIPDPADPSTPMLATVLRLNLSAASTPATVTLELWQCPAPSCTQRRFLVAAPGSVTDRPSWVEFDIPDTWANFTSDHYYILLKNASANLTWWETSDQVTRTWYRQPASGASWDTSGGPTAATPGLQVVDAFSVAGDGLTNYEEYLIGSNPKKRDTDAGTSGPNSAFGDLLSDGQEMINHTIYRTNATLGGLVSTYYNASSWILFDKSLETSDASDWMYFNWLENVTDPNASFAGAKDKTAFLFTLQDGTELRINVSAARLYMYLPGSDFENLINETDHANTTSHFAGQAYVFFQLNNSGAPSDYKTNAIFGAWADEDPWLFFQKQFYASDPFDWDTDNDGLADGWEIDPWHDSDGDFVPNVRDADSDGDSLTDGQEMLQVQWDWFGEHGTTASDLKFDPEGDGLYPMVDTESDGDGIPDAKEVLWSVDTDSDNRINLVDSDSDSDGLCDGWCTSSSTADWRTNEYYAGWNVTLPPGMPNGEDVNQNGTNEQGESSPVKHDTDGDGLWDGYAFNTSAADWQLTQVIGARCNMTGNLTAHCGEESTYSLFNGSFTGKTNRTSPDSDGDGLTDMFEVHGWPIRYIKVDPSVADNYTIANPNAKDTDGDGVVDALELVLGTNATFNDTDLDQVLDGTEDRNRDGFRQSNETSATDQDSDKDGLCDGRCAGKGEDTDFDGVKDAAETDALLADTDGDKLPDGLEYTLMLSKNSGWGLTHDYDGDGVTDLNDKDADNDGLTDSQENFNRNATIDGNETDPYNNDTDGDLLLDGAEPSPFEDTDNDGYVNGRDQDSNHDNVNDNLQVWVAFRTNAVGGDYSGSGVWVALIAPKVNPYYPAEFDFSAGVAYYVHAATLESPPGAGQILNPYGPPGNNTTQELYTPEGYPVLQEGPVSGNYVIYIEVSLSHFEKFTKGGSAPGDYSTSNRSVESFLVNNTETYDGRVATNPDTDFDGLTNDAELACGLIATEADTDGDTILDGVEYQSCRNFDGDSKPDANDTDSDNDGIPDPMEDKNLNGRLDAGETDRLGTDTDGDAILDGTEDANHNGVQDYSGGVHNETSPIDRDSDDDGVDDYAEVHGSWCYVGEASGCGGDTSARYLDPLKVDTDGDLLYDGEEIGLSSPGKDTLASAFRGDSNPSTHTDPKVADTDLDSVADGTEDLNVNGRVDSGEADPLLWDTDRDGLPDGRVSFGGTWKGEDLNNNGVRDQDAEGDWNETDFLANDSDVDGVSDGAELNGTYCFKGGSCANTAHPLLPLNADTDGDQLRDGQELAGWVVGVWYERTMEKKENRSVTSNPWSGQTDSDSDNLTDFEEFMNGSDPRSGDTDGDLISDWWEIQRKSNITGIEGTPPQIANVSLQVGIDWDWWGFLYLPLRSHVTVSFDVSDNVGVGRVDVKFIRYTGTEVVHLEWTRAAAPTSYSFSHRFDFSIAEALVAGADVNITAFDVNENGAWGDFHIKSILEAIADAIAAFLSAIAKVIVEAVSAAFAWITDFVESLIAAVVKPIFDVFKSVAQAAIVLLAPSLASFRFEVRESSVNQLGHFLDDVLNPVVSAINFVVLGIVVIQALFMALRLTPAAPIAFGLETILPVIIGGLFGVILGTFLMPSIDRLATDGFTWFVEQLCPECNKAATDKDGKGLTGWLVELLTALVLLLYVKKGPYGEKVALDALIATQSGKKPALDIVNLGELILGLFLVLIGTACDIVGSVEAKWIGLGLTLFGYFYAFSKGIEVIKEKDVFDRFKLPLYWIDEMMAGFGIAAATVAWVAKLSLFVDPDG